MIHTLVSRAVLTSQRDTDTIALAYVFTCTLHGFGNGRFAQFLSLERKARVNSKSANAKKQPANKQAADSGPAKPASEDKPKSEPKSEAKPESQGENQPAELAKPAVPKLDHAPKAKSAVEKVKESQVELQERAYVTFPYYPSQQFFDNPFETTTMGSTYNDSPHAYPSFQDPVYTASAMSKPDSELYYSSDNYWRGDQSTTTSFSNSSLSGRSSTFSEHYDSDQSAYTYHDNAYQISYPQTQSTTAHQSSQPAAQGSSSRYQDYFNIFS